METKDLEQKVIFQASPHDVYETLMDSGKHSELTGAPASISREVGGKISVYDGEIDGEILELVPDKRIVQSWRYSDWPEGHYSRAEFTLNEVPDGTELVFSQAGIPEELYEDIRQGWIDYYWEPMKELLEGPE